MPVVNPCRQSCDAMYGVVQAEVIYVTLCEAEMACVTLCVAEVIRVRLCLVEMRCTTS